MCGEKFRAYAKVWKEWGSPPHVRGKEWHCLWAVPLLRITPAHAGKRRSSHGHRRRSWDHPRVCGEKFPSKLLSVVILGSPPHVRGKERWSAHRALPLGITPAYAGKSGWASPAACMATDYPRMCGEKVVVMDAMASSRGSPPHVRGKVSQFVDLLCGDGITPAYAGKSARAAMLGNKV